MPGIARASAAAAPLAELQGAKNPSDAMLPDSPKILNLAEAAALVRCSRAHLSNVINGKITGVPQLPAVRIGRRVLFRRESIEIWLKELESAASPQSSR